MTRSLDTLFTGRNHIALDTVASTNTYMAELQRTERLPEGTAVTALSQDGGRGQYGRHWHSEHGLNLLVSYLFYPTFLDTHLLQYLNMTFALGVSDLITELLKENVRIKWPNDIYYQDKKVAGLLTENNLGEDKVRQTILGIGLNVNQEIFPETLPNPVSLKMVTGEDYALLDMLNGLSNALERRYLQLRRGDLQGIRLEYHQRLYLHGKWEWFEAQGKRFKGMIMGVNRDGQLMIQEDSGRSSVYEMKQIRYLTETGPSQN
jgi:BirA family biotin operon repressor/biotin-[acetyl-CoA-carboxylase] ligase